jgi:GGDEF domain-containing protein
MLERLLALLRGPSERLDEGSDNPCARSSTPQDFDRSLDQKLVVPSAGSAVLAGSLQLIGLDDVKIRLGGLWDRVADQILAISEEEISARLSEGDGFRRYNGHTFLICFAGSDQRAAEILAHEVSAAIRKRIAVDIPATGGLVSVAATTALVSTADFQDAVDIEARLLSLLEKVREDIKMTSRDHRSKVIQNFTAHYFPAISPTKHRIIFNTCTANVALALPSLATFRAMADSEQYQETLCRLDHTLLVSAVEALHRSSKQRGCCPLLIPVHLDSLRDRRARAEFVKLLAAIPETYRRFILLEITGATTAADCVDLAFIAPELQNRVKRLVLEVALDLVGCLAPDRAIWGVSVSLHGRTSIEPELPALLSRYVHWATGEGLVTIGHGANSLGLALLAQKAGFHAIDGPAVYPSSSLPKPSSQVARLDRSSVSVSTVHRRV